MKISERQKNLVKDLVKYITPVLTVDGLAIMASGMMFDVESHNYLENAYNSLEKSFKRYQRRTRSNNWLKMHGIPMRRNRK